MAIVKRAGIPKLGMVTDPIEGAWPPEEPPAAPAGGDPPASGD